MNSSVGGFADGSFWPIAPFPGLIEMAAAEGNRTNPEIGKTAVHEEQCKIASRLDAVSA